MTPPPQTSVKCVVDFFGPTLSPVLTGPWDKMPPLLIHHGLADKPVEPFHSEHLMSELKKAGKVKGKDFHFEPYKDQGHGFTGNDLTKSRAKTVDAVGHSTTTHQRDALFRSSGVHSPGGATEEALIACAS
jgi:dienelactone hydrolase